MHPAIYLTIWLGKTSNRKHSINEPRGAYNFINKIKFSSDFKSTPHSIRISLPSELHCSSLINARWNNHLNAPLCLNSAPAIASATLISNYLPITMAFWAGCHLEFTESSTHNVIARTGIKSISLVPHDIQCVADLLHFCYGYSSNRKQVKNHNLSTYTHVYNH